jgi:hypothetical protein
VGALAHLQSSYLQETCVGVGTVVNLRASIYRKYVLVWELWLISELRLTGNICWCGTSGLFTELLFTGNMFWCGNSGSFTGCFLQEICVGVGTVVNYGAAINRKHLLVWDMWFIYGPAIYIKYVLVWEQWFIYGLLFTGNMC